MARLHIVITPLLIVVVCCVVARAHPITAQLPKALIPPPKAAGGMVIDPSWLARSEGASQDVSHMRILSRRKRRLTRASNWFKRLYDRVKISTKKFFQSELWGKYRYITSVSTVYVVISTSIDTFFQSVGLGEIGSISTYMDFFWLLHEIVQELKDLADERCFYPTYWPINKLTPEHCNPYRELQELLDKADELESES